VRNFNANPQNKQVKLNGSGQLKVPIIWPFAVKRWILAVGPNYEWSLVGNPNHKSLWIFSRTPSLAPEVLASIKAQAAQEGYPVDRLLLTPQTTPPPTTPSLSQAQ